MMSGLRTGIAGRAASGVASRATMVTGAAGSAGSSEWRRAPAGPVRGSAGAFGDATVAAAIGPGERTARFRIGGDQPVLDAEGRSRISMEDAAVALIDEAELPRFVQRRFTIGY